MKTFEITVGGKPYKIDIEDFDGKRAVVKVDGKPFEIDVKKAADSVLSGAVGSSYPSAETHKAAPAVPEPPVAHVGSVPSGGEVIAPMPGLILKVMVSVGDRVAAGTPVIKIEAMKMENEIPAPATGKVNEIRVKEGDRVSTDETLLVIDVE